MAEVELIEKQKELEFTKNINEDFVSFRFNTTGKYKVELKFTDYEGNEYIKKPIFLITDFE